MASSCMTVRERPVLSLATYKMHKRHGLDRVPGGERVLPCVRQPVWLRRSSTVSLYLLHHLAGVETNCCKAVDARALHPATTNEHFQGLLLGIRNMVIL